MSKKNNQNKSFCECPYCHKKIDCDLLHSQKDEDVTEDDIFILNDGPMTLDQWENQKGW